MSGNGTSIADIISYNSKAVLLGLFALVSFVLIVFFAAVIFSEPEQIGHLNPVFIAAVSGTLALGGTLVSQLWGNKSGNINGFDKPSIFKTTPTDSQLNVPIEKPIISASFNRIMDEQTVNSTTFTVKNATAKDNPKVEGKIELIGADAKFTPSGPLTKDTKYTATISKDVKDISGNKLGADKIWSFTTTKQ